MKTQKRPLHSALQILNKVVDNKSSLQALSYVKLAATRGTVTLTATNMDQRLTTEIPGEGELIVCVPAKTFMSLVKPENKKDDGEVEITVLDETTVIVTVDNFKTHMTTIPVEDFPEENTDDFNLLALWPAKPLLESLTHVLPAASNDPTRPHICCVSLEDERICCTDGHRLHTAKLPTQLSSQILIPVPAAKTLQRVLKNADSVVIARSEDRLKIRAGQFTLETKLVDATFPPVDQVIPTRHETKLIVDAVKFANAVKRVGMVSKSRGVRLTVNGAIEVSSSDEDCEANVVVTPIENNHLADSPDLTLGVASGYVLDAIGKEKGEAILEFGGPLDPVLLRHGEDRLSVVMPTRL
jgi:DNA polymerase III subunit beta